VGIEHWASAQVRVYAYVIDRAEPRRHDEIATSMANERQRHNLVYRLEGRRLRTFGSVRVGGEPIVIGGVLVANRAPTPWFNKCR
jgi:hypothetical protein